MAQDGGRAYAPSLHNASGIGSAIFHAQPYTIMASDKEVSAIRTAVEESTQSGAANYTGRVHGYIAIEVPHYSLTFIRGLEHRVLLGTGLESVVVLCYCRNAWTNRRVGCAEPNTHGPFRAPQQPPHTATADLLRYF